MVFGVIPFFIAVGNMPHFFVISNGQLPAARK